MKNLTLISLVNLAIKHILLIIAIAVIFAVGAFSYCEFIAEPEYSAKGAILITNGSVFTDESGNKTAISNTDITASLNISDTVIDMLKTSDLFMEFSEELDSKYKYDALMDKATIRQRSANSLFLDVYFTAKTPEEAVELVNTYLSLTPDFIADALPGVNSKVFVATTASKVFPRTATITVLAGLIGAIAAYGVLFIIDILDTVIHDEEDFKSKFDIPVIGSVPDFTAASSSKAYKSYGYGSYERGGTKNG